MSDVFLTEDTRRLLKGKTIAILGDSIIRGLYKDIVWLLNDNSFIPYECLSAKGEPRFPDFNNWKQNCKKISPRIRSIFNNDNRDSLLKFQGLHSGRSYIEPRHYYREDLDLNIYFLFISRIWSKDLDEWLTNFEENTGRKIDLMLMSSCLWDFNRWGPFGVREYKENVIKLLKKVKECLPSHAHFVWLTAMPTSKLLNSKAMQVPGLEFQCESSRYNVTESNFYTANKVAEYGYHVIDLHYYSLIQSFRRIYDGIHWNPETNRMMTNMVLTYLSLILNEPLPGRVKSNVSLEKIKMMFKVANEEEKISSDGIAKRLEDLSKLAAKITPGQNQILLEMKEAEAVNERNPIRRGRGRGGNRVHPYNMGGPRGGGMGGPRGGFRGRGGGPYHRRGGGQMTQPHMQEIGMNIWQQNTEPWMQDNTNRTRSFIEQSGWERDPQNSFPPQDDSSAGWDIRPIPLPGNLNPEDNFSVDDFHNTGNRTVVRDPEPDMREILQQRRRLSPPNNLQSTMPQALQNSYHSRLSDQHEIRGGGGSGFHPDRRPWVDTDDDSSFQQSRRSWNGASMESHRSHYGYGDFATSNMNQDSSWQQPQRPPSILDDMSRSRYENFSENRRSSLPENSRVVDDAPNSMFVSPMYRQSAPLNQFGNPVNGFGNQVSSFADDIDVDAGFGPTDQHNRRRQMSDGGRPYNSNMDHQHLPMQPFQQQQQHFQQRFPDSGVFGQPPFQTLDELQRATIQQQEFGSGPMSQGGSGPHDFGGGPWSNGRRDFPNPMWIPPSRRPPYWARKKRSKNKD